MTAPARAVWLSGLALLIGMALAPAAADAKTHKTPKAHKANTEKGARSKAGNTPPKSPSEETTAERDRRLYRECKGMHNAGACLGYTR